MACALSEAAKLARELVALPSINPMGRDLPSAVALEHRVTAYLERFFQDLGVPYERQTVAPGRDNIVAHCDISPGRPTFMFEAHQDTVPVDGMTIDPFAARIENGRLYGRGACDVKGGMAAMLAAFARIVREKPPGAVNLVMACTVDEEHTFLGVQELVRCGIKADAAIVAEPTKLNIVHAHKGVARWKLATTGRACHSSSPELGINAIYRMGKILTAIERYADELRASRTDPLLGPPSISVGRIEGGSSVNTVPDFCRIEIDRRIIPGERPEDAPRQLIEYLRSVGIDEPLDVFPLWLSAPALSPIGSEELVQRVGAAIDAVRGSHRVHPVPYGTDASTIALAGIPAVVFGPGDIAQAHTRDEWLPLDELDAACDILYRLVIS
ncbi:MAG: M20 family metallopeptidase [Gemmataceae bacterium]|nr:M20 family metallopeptidase [Gemmataceae bacterium]